MEQVTYKLRRELYTDKYHVIRIGSEENLGSIQMSEDKSIVYGYHINGDTQAHVDITLEWIFAHKSANRKKVEIRFEHSKFFKVIVEEALTLAGFNYTAGKRSLTVLPRESEARRFQYAAKVLLNPVSIRDGKFHVSQMFSAFDRQDVVEISKKYGDEIMQTMDGLFLERDMWFKQPVTLLWNEDMSRIIGYHAYSINNPKYENYIKSYYIMLSEEARGKGLAKTMLIEGMKLAMMSGYVNFMARASTDNDGIKFYESLNFTKTKEGSNEFGSVDYIFTANLFEHKLFK